MAMFKYKYDDLFNPTLHALHQLGGSATVSEIEDTVAQLMNLSEEEIGDVHRGNRTRLSYRLAWARTYLKRYGLLENSQRGIWSLTPEGLRTQSVNKGEVNRVVKALDAKPKAKKSQIGTDEDARETVEGEWQDELVAILQKIPADSFERLCQRMLRELGFINVEVTGKSGDGGIDGTGVVQLGGVLSFQLVFQCKRYGGSVASKIIRDFRGAMVGRADKGLFITTGTFTRDAKKEARRDGAPPIDLIDGFQLAEHLKQLGLGVEVYTEERVRLQPEWFATL